MGLLSDNDLGPLLAQGVLVKGFAAAPRIRGAAVELCIGGIYVPGVKGEDPGSPRTPLNALSLHQGETAVIRTLEELALPQDHAGIAFPAANVSLQGLLMTNPGYVDPGYFGNLHVTVINMGREPYLLKRNDSLMRCLFFKLDPPATLPYPRRPSPIDDALLACLTKDFMNIEERAFGVAETAIHTAELRSKWRQISVPVVVAIISVIGSVLITFKGMEKRLMKVEATIPNVQQLESRMGTMESLLPLEQRVDKLETKTISEIDNRLQRLETKPKH
jgi:dCTP deaminase